MKKQYGFMTRKRLTDTIFALSVLIQKCREGQKELNGVIVDLWMDRIRNEVIRGTTQTGRVVEKTSEAMCR